MQSTTKSSSHTSLRVRAGSGTCEIKAVLKEITVLYQQGAGAGARTESGARTEPGVRHKSGVRPEPGLKSESGVRIESSLRTELGVRTESFGFMTEIWCQN